MTTLPYSLVIPTYELPEELDRTLASVLAQTHLPLEVLIVDSSRSDAVRLVAESWQTRLPIRFLRAEIASAAAQRNQGGLQLDPVRSPIVGFIDDDITLAPDACASVCSVFARDLREETGGVALRIDGMTRPAPSGWSWWYYRLQAGFADRTYGGRLFGAAVNCLPCYTEGDDELVPADWLNSGCVFYRTALFQRERFPAFTGYSFMEDVHLSARIARTHRLYFHKTARCIHRDGAVSRPREAASHLARMRLRNQRLVAHDVLGVRGFHLEWKLFLHRLFATIAILRGRPRGWTREILGTWT